MGLKAFTSSITTLSSWNKSRFGFSNCLYVFVSDAVGVFACVPSLRRRCVLKHIASAEGSSENI